MAADNELAKLGNDSENVGKCQSLQTAVGARGRGVLDESKYNAFALINPDEARVLWFDITPVARRGWIHWITSAKRSETRARRVELADLGYSNSSFAGKPRAERVR
jgi:hypothetical protein